MRAGATLVAKYGAVRSDATAVLRAGFAVAAVFQRGAAAIAVTSSDAVHVASTPCLTGGIGATAHQSGATARAIVSADLLTVAVVARPVCHAIGIDAQTTGHRAAGARAPVFAMLDGADATAVQITLFIVASAFKQSATAIGITTLESVFIVATAHRHADGITARATFRNAMRASAIGSAKASQYAIHHTIAGAVCKTGGAGASARELGHGLGLFILGGSAADQRGDVDPRRFDAVQTEKRRVNINGLIQTDVVAAHKQALLILARVRGIGRAHIKVD